jgi:hypothetical protein
MSFRNWKISLRQIHFFDIKEMPIATWYPRQVPIAGKRPDRAMERLNCFAVTTTHPIQSAFAEIRQQQVRVAVRA